MERSAKHALVETLNKSFSENSIMVVTHYQGLNVAQITNLRRNALQAGVQFKVTKNTLTRLALKGTSFESVTDLFTGPTAIAYSNDPVAVAKVVANFAKEAEVFQIVGGVLNGQPLDTNSVKSLATLPSLDELRAKLLGLLLAPATKVAGVVQAPAGQLARVVGAYAAK